MLSFFEKQEPGHPNKILLVDRLRSYDSECLREAYSDFSIWFFAAEIVFPGLSSRTPARCREAIILCPRPFLDAVENRDVASGESISTSCRQPRQELQTTVLQTILLASRKLHVEAAIPGLLTV